MNLTDAEYNSGRNQVLMAFAAAGAAQRKRVAWALNPDGEKDLQVRLLFLFSWALSTDYLTDIQKEQILQSGCCGPDMLPIVSTLKLNL